MMEKYYLQDAYFLFRQLSCKSRLAFASIFDLVVNKGRYYPVNLIQADFDKIDKDTTLTEAEKEAKKIYQINFWGNDEVNAINDSYADILRERRTCMANMVEIITAIYTTQRINLDLNLEPATSEKANEPINRKKL